MSRPSSEASMVAHDGKGYRVWFYPYKKYLIAKYRISFINRTNNNSIIKLFATSSNFRECDHNTYMINTFPAISTFIQLHVCKFSNAKAYLDFHLEDIFLHI